MLRGLYTAASGMVLNDRQSDDIQENIENLRNPGYRQTSERVTSFPRLLVSRLEAEDGAVGSTPLGIMGTGVYADRKLYDTIPGNLRQTETKTDLALNADGYFVVETLQGERYTRNGQFQLDPAGMLRTAGGNLVLGQEGPIGPLLEDFRVDLDGTIRDTESGEVIDILRIVHIDVQDLQRDGKTNLYISDAEAEPEAIAPEDVRVQQGFIEESNVQLNEQMLKMMQVAKSYSANQKVIQTTDTLLQKAVNEIGKV